MRQPSRDSTRKIVQFLFRRRKKLSPLLILTHDVPDPDALASAWALKYVAEEAFGIESHIAYGGIIGRMENREMVRTLKIPIHPLGRRELKKYQNVALVDTQPAFGNNPFPPNRRAALIIDQHASVEKPAADLAVVDTVCGATSVLLSECLLSLKLDIPVPLATALTYGILSDTMNLYRCHDNRIVRIYLTLLEKSDLRGIARIQNPPRSRSFFFTLRRGIERARTCRKVMVSHVGAVDNPDLVPQIADFLANYRGVNWVLCTGRYKSKLHISLRATRPQAQAAEVLRSIVPDRAQAGGHGMIAGGAIPLRGASTERRWRQAETRLGDGLFDRLRVPRNAGLYYPFRKD